MQTEEKVEENRLRRVLMRRGFTLVKSRRRDPHSADYGGYMILEASGKAVAGHAPAAFSLSLAGVTQWIEQQEHASMDIFRIDIYVGGYHCLTATDQAVSGALAPSVSRKALHKRLAKLAEEIATATGNRRILLLAQGEQILPGEAPPEDTEGE